MSAFQNTTNSTEIVISFAGTNGDGGSILTNPDKQADAALAAGLWSDQLGQAAAYYLEIKAINPGATISFTGHSLGGGLASLMSVLFGETAFTFDQAPFQAALAQAQNLKNYLLTREAGIIDAATLNNLLIPLDRYITAADPNNLNPIVADTLAVRQMQVTNINVQGEFLSTFPWNIPNRIGTQSADIPNNTNGVTADDLHAQSLLTAYLQSNQTAAPNKGLNDVTFKLPDLLKMIFDSNLFAHPTNDPKSENFLEHLVRHEAGVQGSIAADAMVTRFTSDLWKLAQDGGLTLSENYSYANWNNVSKALIAFAMQKYYEENNPNVTYGTELFTDLSAAGLGSNGITFDIANVSQSLNTKLQTGSVKYADLVSDIKGFGLYFQTYLDVTGLLSPEERTLIKSMLPVLRDWYIQAGASGMLATDTNNRGAFMLGGNGADALVGGIAADLLVGNAGDDLLQGGLGNDTLLGGAGNDAYVYTTGDGLDTILDTGGQNTLAMDGTILAGGDQYGDASVHKDANGHLYVQAGNNLIIDGNIIIQNYGTGGTFGLTMNGAAAEANLAALTGNGSDNFIGTDIYNRDPNNGNVSQATLATGTAQVSTLAGLDSANVLEGGAGSDILSGGAGDDRLYADTQADTATAIAQGSAQTGSGLKGDWLAGGAGSDTLVGSTGNDVLSGGDGTDLLIGGAGDDDILGDIDYMATSFDWTVTDTNGTRLFSPVTELPSTGTADVIYAGNGNDHVWGGQGNDVIFGEGDNDKLQGEDGNDIILGGTGTDILWGGAGSDYLDGGDGADELQGGADADILIGGKGIDTLHGGAGKDTYIFSRGDGNDTVIDTKADNNIFRFGAGISASDITLRLGSLMLDLGNGDEIHIGNFDQTDVFNSSSIDRFEFEDGTILTTTELLARGFDLDGTAGDDQIVGTNTTDRINGYGGNDILIGLNGTDTLSGGDGNDELFGDADSVPLAEHGDDILDGGAGDDTLWGEGGNDTLTGGAGNDILYGNEGDDSLAGGIGDDLLTGGIGGDTYIFNRGDGADTIADNGDFGFVDTLQFGPSTGSGQAQLILQSDVSARRTPAGDLQFTLAGSTDSVTIQGWYTNQADANRIERIVFGDGTTLTQLDFENLPITGTEGDDVIDGTSANDTILGLGGNDTLTAGAGSDTLDGGLGDDTLDGGAGDDSLTGGEGQDSYIFTLGMGMDTVTDASLGGNTIELQAGMSFNDLCATQSGNDLLLTIGGTGQGMTLKDYYTTPQDWTVQDSAGAQQSIADVLNATNQDEYSALRDDFFAATKSSIAEGYQAQGYQWQADGTLGISPVGASVAGTFQQTISTSTTTVYWSFDQYPAPTVYTLTDSTLISSYYIPGWGWSSQPRFVDYKIEFSRTLLDIDSAVPGAVTPGFLPSSEALSTSRVVDTQIAWSAPYNTRTTSYDYSTGGAVYGNNPYTGWYEAVGYSTTVTHADTHYFSQNGVLLSIAPGDSSPVITGPTSTIGSPSTVQALLQTDSTIFNLQEIVGGVSDDAIDAWDNPYTVLDGGAGNDTLNGIGLLYGGEGNDVLRGAGSGVLNSGVRMYGGNGNDSLSGGEGAYLDGGAGDDTLTSGSVLLGGAGNDTMDGGWSLWGDLGNGAGWLGKTGETRYLIDPTQTGVDLIRDSGDAEYAYMGWYYGLRGIPDWQERLDYGGQYAMPGWLFDYSRDVRFDSAVADWLRDPALTVDTFPDTYLYEWASWAWPYAKDAVQADPSILRYIEPLPLMNRPAAYDYAALQDAYAAGVIPLDTVEFAAGVTLTDLQLSWGEITQASPISGADEPYRTLVLSWNGGTSQVQLVIPHADDPLGSGVEQIKFADGTVVGMQDLIAMAPPVASLDPRYSDLTLIGTEGADILTGEWANDTLIGLGGDDQLNGGGGNDVLTGGAGNDTLMGGAGDDTYVFEAGNGIDTIIDTAGANKLVFGAGVDPASVTLSLGSLLIRTGNGNDAIHIQGFDQNDVYAPPIIASFQFADGSTLSYTQLLERGFDIAGTAGDDNLTGTNINDRIDGGAGNDTLSGGAGNDVLNGGSGSDTYVIGTDGGQDTIVETYDPGSVDKIVFAAGIAAADLVTSRGGAGNNDLVVSVSGTNVTLTIQGWFDQASPSSRGSMEFADGSVVAIDTIVNHAPTLDSPLADQTATVGETFSFAFAVNTPVADSFMDDATDPNVSAIDGIFLGGSGGDDVLAGTSGNDNLYGDAGNDVLDGGAGNDILEDDLGNDTYLFGRGYGQDVVYEWDSTAGNVDAVRFAADVLPGDVTVYENSLNGSLVLSINGTSDTLTVNGWFSSDARKVEQFVFADGTVWGVNDITSIMVPLPAISVGSDEIVGTVGNDTIKSLAGDDLVSGEAGDDVLAGGAGDDELDGGTGSDILNGGSGWDTLFADWSYSDLGNDLLAGGADGDNLNASISNDLLVGGTGNDDVIGDDGNDVVLFNRGDGNDWYGSSISQNGVPLAQRADTVSLGGGITYSDLSFERGPWNSLLLNLGNGESIMFDGWFDTSLQDNKAISTLQVIVEAMPGYDPNSADPLLNKRIQQFDFAGLAGRFEADLAADSTIVTWQLAPHLGTYHLGGSDVAAIGGDMAYLYGKNGNLDGLTETELRGQLGDAGFGTANQTLTKISMGTGGVFGDVDMAKGDSLTYSATLSDGSPLPAWLGFDAATAIFSGTPGSGDSGILSVTVTATDTGGLSATSTFQLSVASLNAAPVAVADMVAISGDAAQAAIAVADLLANDIDPDAGDILSISSFDAVTAQGNLVSLDEAGNLVLDVGNRYQSLGVGQGATDSFSYTVTDAAGATSAATVNVAIAGVNDAPVVAAALVNQQTTEDALFSFTVPADTFADVDNGDILTYSATLANGSALPAWLSFDTATRIFSGTPGNLDVGGLNVLITATDTGGLSASSEFALNVANTNDAPTTSTALAAQEAVLNAVFSFAVPAGAFDDADTIHGEMLTFSATLSDGTALPGWLTFDAATQTFSGTPGATDIQALDLRLTVTDSGGLSAATDFVLNMRRVNADGSYTRYASDGQGTLTTTNFNAAGNRLSDSWTSNGSHGTNTYGPDGSRSSYTVDAAGTVIYANYGSTGRLLNDYWVKVDGSTGSSSYNPDGSYSSYSVDAAGTKTSRNYDAAGRLVNEYWVKVDGSSSSSTWNADGSHSSYTIDTARTGTYSNYDAAGRLVSDNWVKANGSTGLDTYAYNPDGTFGRYWQRSDGNQGVDAGANRLAMGGWGWDTVSGGMGNDMLAGRWGNDTIAAGDGADIILFNRGDGRDVVDGGIGTDNTLALGGGIRYADLALSRTARDLILEVGNGEQITLSGWYDTGANHKSVLNLQMVSEAMAGFNRTSTDPMLNKSVQDFDFTAIVDAFDQASGGNVNAMHWSMTNSLLTAHLSSSDTEALGGDLAYLYGKNYTLTGMGLNATQSVLAAPQFGAQAQAIGQPKSIGNEVARLV